MSNPKKLRELAGWYRALAERTANAAIWDFRLRTAEDLEAEAERIEASRRQSIADRGADETRCARSDLVLSRTSG